MNLLLFIAGYDSARHCLVYFSLNFQIEKKIIKIIMRYFTKPSGVSRPTLLRKFTVSSWMPCRVLSYNQRFINAGIVRAEMQVQDSLFSFHIETHLKRRNKTTRRSVWAGTQNCTNLLETCAIKCSRMLRAIFRDPEKQASIFYRHKVPLSSS